ncbi:MAG TPA: ATP-binding cassette domain-containing protein, partial [Nocardioides sp.]|nr:ATP-binding cassette domain-containing protein [Nocardioides sp.]
REIVMSRLEEVGLTRAVSKYPGEVSGGMKKRAGFARALVLNPSVVMFDEPDSGLDPVRTSLLNDLILKVHAEHGGTYVLVTHDIRTARKVSDYVGVVWKGKLIHYGETEEAFNSDMPFVRQFLSGESVGPLGMD